jgi:hypothetical protein
MATALTVDKINRALDEAGLPRATFLEAPRATTIEVEPKTKIEFRNGFLSQIMACLML